MPPTLHRTMRTTDHAAAMLAWLEDAQAALEMGHALSPAHVLALAATPATAPHRSNTSVTTPRTWFLEEYEREMREQLRDPVPMAGTLGDVATWRDRQARRSEDLAQLVADHATCLMMALAFVNAQPAPRVSRSTTRRGLPRKATAVELALSAIRRERAA